MRGSVFSALARRLESYPGEVYPLHVGDTWMEPAEGCRMEDLRVAEHPGMHRYAAPQGRSDLVAAIVERQRERVGAAGPENVLVAAGATGSLGAVTGALLEPGEEVLILAPYWPLIFGIVQSARGVPVEVPFFESADSPETAVEAIAPYLSERTAALYISTPNNPSGRIIPPVWLEAMCAWAARNDLWILSDEVYEDYVYEGEHLYCRSLAPDRTFSVHSFSKAYGMAGNRCGYVVGPAEAMTELRKVSTHTFYSTPTASQIAALNALGGAGDRWIEEARPLYRDLGVATADRLGVPRPEGSQFLFLDVGECLDERGLLGFLEEAADRGLFMAPGPSFGPYPHHVRICYTAARPDVTKRGIEALADLLGRT
jgi:N-succinyldiaminopimelate aminotransferase